MVRSEGTKSSRNSILGRQQGTGRGGRAAPPGQSQSPAPDEAEFVGCDQTIYGWFRRWLALGLFDALLREVARRRRRKGGRDRRWLSSMRRRGSASPSAGRAATPPAKKGSGAGRGARAAARG